ncbi:glycosyltransferase family 61 protein [Sporomusa acidovorans]|uniref:Glycosyltransferase 61 catalytic domain-containing protein n=1 Tax=Sporomusa acidovorans (strain ATCC 49682 / DSM 3132 / Mol) TaxID=1123286 RepID=A0ABZ3JB44_SPOA4|nr:glycosyltransferase family 61 protein [Sporomusa acidovorans]OZC15143.1 hypothetical protein SPACI_50550 [Sporomusa acidovorans DSM 3132]SDF43969.1 Protein of unknown function [Sporomusa acidovorans]
MISVTIRNLYEWLKEKKQIIYENCQEPILIEEPKLINSDKQCGSTITRPPDSYIGLLHSVYVVGGTRIIINSDKELLYDELALFQHSDYGVKPHSILQLTAKDKANIKAWTVTSIIKEGILINCDHDANYFHWLVECLPKLVFLDTFEEFRDIPLLVREDLHPNLLQALERINKTHPIIHVKYGHLYLVEKLIYVSDLSRILDRYHGTWNLETDSVIGPYWLKKLVEKLTLGYHTATPWRKLYLYRGNRYRCLLNESEVELELLKRGFEIIDLQARTFEFQLILFSQAETVIAPSAATLTNILLCQKNTRIVALTHDYEGIGFHIWPQLAAVSEVFVEQFIGRRVHKQEWVHDDYTIPLDRFFAYLDSVMHSGGRC